MRQQMGRAMGQVREWALREQREQLLQQARQLQEEAERFGSKEGGGGVGGDGCDGSYTTLFRSDLTEDRELTAKLSSEMQERLKAERTKLKERL